MLQRTKIIKFAIYGLLLFALGWIIGLFVKDLNWFEYDSSFNLFELFYCLVTVFISIYIANVIENVLQNNRNQKDIIIKKIEEVDTALVSLLALFKYDKSSHKYSITNFEILSNAKHISILSQRYQSAIKKYYPALYNNKDFSKINTRHLVRECTGITVVTQNDIRCIQDVWYYSQDRFVNIREEINSLRDICFEDILRLNEQ